MLRKLLATSVLSFASLLVSYAQVGQGALKGKVTDKESKEPLPFVNVVLELNGTVITGAASDFDGNFMIKPIPPGKYDIKASFTGYQPVQISGAVINAEKITFQNIAMTTTAIDIKEFEVIAYTVPLIDKDNTATGATITREDIDKLPGRSAASVAQTVGGVYSKDDGSNDLNIRGGRSDANYYFIDGMKVRGSNNLPKASIEQVTVITGGLPAQYGDVTGGVISITTRGASREYGGSIDYQTSGWRVNNKMYGLDAFGSNLLEYSVNGPLLMKKDTAGNKTEPLIGFFFSGNFSSDIDKSPSAIGWWKVKDDVRDDLIANPLRTLPGRSGTYLNHEFIRMSDMEKVKTMQNSAERGLTLSGKIDVNTGKTTNLTFGGNLDFNKQRNYARSSDPQARYFYENSLMNWNNNPERIQQTWRAYSRFTQRFSNRDESQEEKSSSTVKNAFYSIQLDYTKDKRTDQDDIHKDKLFNYGHIGKFKRYRAPFYEIPGGPGQNAFIMRAYRDTLIAFDPGTLNPEATQFTKSYYELFGWDFNQSTLQSPVYNYSISDPNAGTGNIIGVFNADNIPMPVFEGDLTGAFDDYTIMQLNGALRNGDGPRSIYGMWRTPAHQYNTYEVVNNSQFRVNATGSADIFNHAISVGFEYEQRVDRSYSISPVGLWEYGRQYTNNHLSQLDTDNPIITSSGTMFPFISYNILNPSPGAYDAAKDGGEPQAFFDYNLRNKLGLDPDGIEWIDFDSYDPDMYSVNMFSADELNNNLMTGSGAGIRYYGYDHTGVKMKKSASFSDYFTERDKHGNLTRPIDAFRPVYVAGFVQDKFAFDDLVFNIGMRVDRFDANQYVLKDPFSLFPTVKAEEDLTQFGIKEYTIPSNIGGNYVVYTDDINNPSKITGFRNGNTWYNAEGTEIADALTIRTPSGVAPLLVDKTKTASENITIESFEDYTPQTNFMPRIAFSFPISDEALFFAHYDVLTKRPTVLGGANAIRLNPAEYYYLQNITYTISNPNLKPEKTIDYEAGFQQKLNNFSSLKLSAFYRELRDMVQVVNVIDAFPKKYRTYGNIDFGTIKGMTVAYDLRKTGNLKTRVSYTLQFAEGTGSDAQSGLNLATQEKQNLRTSTPLNYDQRHAIITTVDYRYGEGSDYNGPLLFNQQIFANTGANFVFNAGSGTPYSQQQGVTSEAFFSPVGNSSMKGTVNGARLPWNFRADARIDRDIQLTWKTKGAEGEETNRKIAQMNIYLQVLNVLNSKNIIDVYRATGNPDDDGYLAAAVFQTSIQSQNNEQSFRELYNAKINSPFSYSLPRRIRLGLLLNF